MARRDKKAFLSYQCKEIEENNRMGKTRDLFKKIRDTKETFQAKMSTIKDRNGMDLVEAEAVDIICLSLSDLPNSFNLHKTTLCHIIHIIWRYHIIPILKMEN